VQLEAICPLCGGRGISTRFPVSDLPILECGCGMVFLYPHPDAAELAGMYGAGYFEGWGGGGDEDAAARAVKQLTFSSQLDLLRNVKPGRVLDVGCATGYFIEVAAAAGWEPYGVEVSEFAASVAARSFGDRIFQGTLEQADYPDRHFDLVMLSDLLEHIPEPLPFLREVRRVLAPGGVLMIVTPDVGSLSARIMGRRWNHYHREHLHYFSAQTIDRLLAGAGFSVRSSVAAPKHLNIAYLAAQLRLHRHPVLTPLAELADRLLPSFLKKWSLPLPCGQMLVLASPLPTAEPDTPRPPGEGTGVREAANSDAGSSSGKAERRLG
jgi:SAM-dependent methyltransferase